MTKKTIVLRAADAPPRPRKPKRLINPKEVRKKVLAVLYKRRPALAEKMSRVSAEFITALEGDLLNAIDSRIDSAPTIGKTLKPYA